MKPKVKIYIDGANIFYTQKRLGWSIDWKKAKDYLEKDREVVEWRYYVGLRDDDEKMQKYLRYLNKIGFNTITKQLKKIRISNGEKDFIYKANFDVEITTDILLDKFKVEEIIVFSGDSDFLYLIKKLKDLGIKVSICASKKTISWELKLSGSHIFYLDKMKNNIVRDK